MPQNEDVVYRLSTFEMFALLPAEIRNLIWSFACAPPPRVYFLTLSKPPPQPVPGRLQDPADARNQSHRNDLAILLSHYRSRAKNYWNVPGCVRYASALRLPNTICRVCPEAKAEFYRAKAARNKGGLRLKGRLMPPVNEADDIFCFRTHASGYRSAWTSTVALLSTKPQIRPVRIAIELHVISEDRPNFAVDQKGRAQHNLPAWLTKSIEWARDAREERLSGLQVVVKPPQEDLAIDLQNLQTVFLLSYGIEPREARCIGKYKRVPKDAYTGSVDGYESRFFILDPSSPRVLRHWNIPTYVWAARGEMQRLLESSETWKVNVNFMAAIEKDVLKKHRSLLVGAPTARDERSKYARSVGWITVHDEIYLE